MIDPLLLLERLYKVGVLPFQATETDSTTKQNKNEGGGISWNTGHATAGKAGCPHIPGEASVPSAGSPARDDFKVRSI